MSQQGSNKAGLKATAQKSESRDPFAEREREKAAPAEGEETEAGEKVERRGTHTTYD